MCGHERTQILTAKFFPEPPVFFFRVTSAKWFARRKRRQVMKISEHVCLGTLTLPFSTPLVIIVTHLLVNEVQGCCESLII